MPSHHGCKAALRARAADLPVGRMDDCTIMLSRLALGLPFTFVHFNDGEVGAAMYEDGLVRRQQWSGSFETPAGNQAYSGRLRHEMRRSMNCTHPRLYAGLPCPAESTLLTRAHHEARTLVKAEKQTVATVFANGNYHQVRDVLPSLIGRRLRDGARLHLVVSRLANVERFGNATGLHVTSTLRAPAWNAFDAYSRLTSSFADFAAGDIVVVCVGMLGRMLVTRWLPERPDTTFLELGSFFNPELFAGPSTKTQLERWAPRGCSDSDCVRVNGSTARRPNAPGSGIRVRMAYHRSNFSVPCRDKSDLRADFDEIGRCFED